MNYYKISMLLLLSTVAVSEFTLTAHAASWRITPSIEVSEIYTDNVDLDASVSQSDFVTQVSPQIAITGEGSRLNTSILYAPNYFFYPGDDDDQHELRHTLQASFNSEFIREVFFVEASANISQRFLDRRQAISSEQASRTENRGTIQAYRFSPYLTHTFGSWATAQLRYDLSHVRQAEDAGQTTLNTFFGNSLSHEGRFTVTSGRRFSKLGWTLLASHRSEEREQTANFKSSIAQADFSYQLTNMFALLGSAGYEDRQAVGSFADFDGFIWDAGFRFVPGPRTSVSFRYGNKNDGDTFSLDALYKITSKNTITLSYIDSIQTFQSFAFQDNNSVILDPALNSGFISGDLTRRKSWTLAISGQRGRTTYSASAFYNKDRSDNVALGEKRYGGVVSIQRNLNHRLDISSSFSYNLSRFSSDNINDKYWSASVNLNYQLSKSLLGTIGYIHTDRDQTRVRSLNGGSNYVSLTIRATL